MANFLIVLSSRPQAPQPVFERAMDANARLKKQPVLASINLTPVQAAVFARRNGTGGEIARDSIDRFLLATGTWLHRDGYGTGSAPRLLQRFLEVGAEQLAQELEGFFFIAAGNGADEIVAITDIIGSHHAFMRQLDNAIVLSGSSAVLAALAPYTLDEIACQEFIRTGIIYEQRTIYNEVRKLPPASILTFKNGRLENQRRYWDPSTLSDQPLALHEAADALYDIGTRTVKRIAELYPRVLCDLTGGYDSRALGALLLGAKVPFDTTVSGADDSPDVRISGELAKIAGLKHTQRQRSNELAFEDLEKAFELCDGEYDLAEYAYIMRTHDAHSQDYDVTLNGSFGEVARGYWWELLSPQIGKRVALNSAKIARKRYAAIDKGAHLFPAGTRLDLDKHFTEILNRTGRGLETQPNTLQLDYSYLMLRMQRWQGRIASSTDQIWPCVSPFMFRSVLEVMLRAAPSARHRSLLVRAMLSRHCPKWAAHPLEHGYPAQPFSARNARRFLPLISFYAGKVSRKLAKHLTRSTARRQGANANLPTASTDVSRSAGLPSSSPFAAGLSQDAMRRFSITSTQYDDLDPALQKRILGLEFTLCHLKYRL